MNLNTLQEKLEQIFPLAYRKSESNIPGDTEYEDSYKLILINYKPVTLWINNVIHYGFLNLKDYKMIWKHSLRSRSPKTNYYGKNLELIDVCSEYNFPKYLIELQSLSENEICSFPDTFPNDIEYAGYVNELEAISLKTEDFIYLEEVARNETSGQLKLKGITLAQEVRSKIKGTSRPMHLHIKDWYEGYMYHANIDLCDMYYRFKTGRSKNVYIYRMDILNEFVPFLVKFDGIYHPILDTPLLSALQRRYPFFNNLDVIPATVSIWGKALERVTEDSATYYTLRGTLKRLLTLTVDPAEETPTHIDRYSVKFFSTIILNLALEGLGEKISYADKFKWNIYTGNVGDEEPHIIFLSNQQLTEVYGREVEISKSLGYLSFLVYEYCLYLERAALTPAVETEVARVAFTINNSLNIRSFSTLESI